MWTEGRQGHWVIQSSLEGHVFITRESWTAHLLPSKATVCSPKPMQIEHEARPPFGHFQDECEDAEGAIQHRLSIIL